MKATNYRMPAETQTVCCFLLVSCVRNKPYVLSIGLGIKMEIGFILILAFLLLQQGTQSSKCKNSALYDW